MKLKIQKTITDEYGEISVADDYEYTADIINTIRERTSQMTPEQEYTFYKYCLDVLNDLEFIEGDE